MLRKLSIALSLSLASAAFAQSAVPLMLTQQGRLLDGQDQPVTGVVNLTFTIYNESQPSSASQDVVEWSDTFSDVEVNQGVYGIVLGDVKNGHALLPSSVFPPGQDRFLAIAVNGGSEMTPRLRLASVPYAYLAGDLSCDGCVTAADVAPGVLTGDAFSDASITGVKIGSATITGANIASGTITGGNIANGSIPPSKLAGPIDAATLNGDTASEIIAMAQKAIPPASNYIANGSSAQNASFNITGSGAVGGNLSVGGRLDVSGLLTAAGNIQLAGGAMVASSAQDNFTITTKASGPNPNFSLGIGDGSGGIADTPMMWNGMLVLNGSGQSWCPSCANAPTARHDLVIASNGNVGIGTASPQGFQIALPESSKPVSPNPGVTMAGGPTGNADIELRNNGTGQPYIDFADSTSDFDSRIIMEQPGTLAIEGAGAGPLLHVAGDENVDGVLRSKGSIVASSATYNWTASSLGGSGYASLWHSACPAGFHPCDGFEAIVRLYTGGASNVPGNTTYWTTGGISRDGDNSSVVSFFASWWGGTPNSACTAGYHWAQGVYNDANSQSHAPGCSPDGDNMKLLCCANY